MRRQSRLRHERGESGSSCSEITRKHRRFGTTYGCSAADAALAHRREREVMANAQTRWQYAIPSASTALQQGCELQSTSADVVAAGTNDSAHAGGSKDVTAAAVPSTSSVRMQGAHSWSTRTRSRLLLLIASSTLVAGVQDQRPNASQPMLLQGTELHPPASPPSEVPVFLRVIHTDDDEQHAMPPLAVQAISTLAVCTFLLLLAAAVRLYCRRKRQQQMGGLPDASPDGTWLLVTYDWGSALSQSGRMPLEGINSISDLVCAVVEYGAESVDSEINSHNVDVRYTDGQGVERRLGAKTRFTDVLRARMLRITRRVGDSKEKAGLMWGVAAGTSKRRLRRPIPIHETVHEEEGEDDDDDDDDVSVIESGRAAAMMQPAL
uniref:Uncharacterized protein n=1 Tax=Chrysotila carterae TaxID=13221 RepID=A0A7S4B251_CHRCT